MDGEVGKYVDRRSFVPGYWTGTGKYRKYIPGRMEGYNGPEWTSESNFGATLFVELKGYLLDSFVAPVIGIKYGAHLANVCAQYVQVNLSLAIGIFHIGVNIDCVQRYESVAYPDLDIYNCKNQRQIGPVIALHF